MSRYRHGARERVALPVIPSHTRRYPGCTDCECPGGGSFLSLQRSGLDGSNPSPIPGVGGPGAGGTYNASWSPDGSRIVLEYLAFIGSSSCEDFHDSSVAVAKADGSGFVALGPTDRPLHAERSRLVADLSGFSP